MESFALLVALILLGLGGLLNTAVFGYFALRILQAFRGRHQTAKGRLRPALAPATR